MKLPSPIKQPLRALYKAIPFKQSAFSALRKVYIPPRAIYQHLHFEGVFRIPVADKSFLINNYGLDVENTVFWRGLEASREGVSLGLWIRLCQTPGLDVVVDGGANTGIYSLVTKALSPKSRVLAYEPVTRIREKLSDNCRLNGFDIHCIEKGLSDADGRLRFYDIENHHAYAASLEISHFSKADKLREIEIEIVRLDSELDALPQPARLDLIKLDVESHEPQALSGMTKYLKRDRPTMLIEILSDKIAGQVEELVDGLGYQYYNIHEERQPKRQAHISRSDGFNFLLCSPEKARVLGLS